MSGNILRADLDEKSDRLGHRPFVGLRPGSGARSDRAYVTLVTNSDYARGARALLRSLNHTGTRADKVVLYTPDVPLLDLAGLLAEGARLVETDLLPTSAEFDAAHCRDALHGRDPFTKGTKPVFHAPLKNFVKLRAWQLTEYRSCVFIDADALVLRNCDHLFDFPNFCAAPNVYESLTDFGRLNSGVFTLRPDPATFAAMLEALDRPGVFWRRTDQTFLESYFPRWHGLPVYYNMLQYVWFNLPELWDWKQVHVVHYQYEKPWETSHGRSHLLTPLIDLWQAYDQGSAIPDPDGLAGPSPA